MAPAETEARACRLLMIRHGETAHNVEGRISTAAPGGPLSARGKRQAEALATALAALDLAAVYSSPLTRARETAAEIARPQRLEVEIREDLAELCTGEVDGRSDQEAFDTLNRALDAWARFEHDVRIAETGEVGTAVCERVRAFVSDVYASHPQGTVVAVSHGGTLQTGIPWLAANLPAGFAVRRFIGNAGVIELDVAADGVTCVSWDGLDPSEWTTERMR